MITSLTTVRDHGRDVTTFVESGGATFVCDGLLNGWDGLGSANIRCVQVRPDLIAYRGFEL